MFRFSRISLCALAVTALSTGFLSPAHGVTATSGSVTTIMVWGDSMTQIWPGYLEELVGIPVIPKGVGGATVQQTQQSFTEWVEANRDTSAFATTGHLCWCGHTNLNVKNSQSPTTDRQTIVPAQQAMAGMVPAGLFRPIGLTNGPDAPSGSTAYRQSVEDGDAATRTAVNEQMQDAFGAAYAEVRRYLVTDGLRVAGFAATTEDEANIAADVPPRSLRTDVGNPAHLNDAGRHVTAARLADLLRAGGWVDAATNDLDGDGFTDDVDNCPVEPNGNQADSDGNGVGDACATPVPLVIANTSVTEDYGTATFTLTLSAPLAVDSSVEYAAADVTALAGQDYTAPAPLARVTIDKGRTVAYVRVAVTPDTAFESDELFNIVLRNSSPTLVIRDDTGTATILNDDAAPPSADTTPPTAVKQLPATSATAVAPAAKVSITFSEPVTGVSTTSVTLTDPAGAVVEADVGPSNGGKTATLNPTANLRADTRYTATFTGGAGAITDQSGNAFATASWTFLTGPRPTVRGISPADKATQVAVGTNVVVTLSESLAGTTDTTFRLLDPAGALVPAVVSRTPGSTLKWTLDPRADLTPGTTYTVRLIGGPTAITDLAGNPLTTYTATFTTAA